MVQKILNKSNLFQNYILLALFVMIIKPVAIFSQNIPTEKIIPLKILSWNIYMLPSIANLSKEIQKSDKKTRAEQISEIMNSSDYDIIVFQEAFFKPAKNILAKELKEKYPFQYGPINKGFIKTNSGVFIVSKIELKELATIKYSDCEGTDCLAKKGAGIFEGNFHGKPFQIIGTHLDSKSQKVRDTQYKQIYEKLIKPYTKYKIPLIICGDMNTRFSRKNDYKNMLKSLQCEDIITNSSYFRPE